MSQKINLTGQQLQFVYLSQILLMSLMMIYNDSVISVESKDYLRIVLKSKGMIRLSL